MPRSTRSRSRKLEVPTPDIEKDVSVTTATEDNVRELTFELNITPAPEDYRPDRSPAGRKRTPSIFEPILPDLKGKGWQNQPHDGKVTPEKGSVEDGTAKYNTTSSVAESNAKDIHRELSKAVKFLNSEEGGSRNLGLDINITATDVQFNIRDKQARKSKTVDGDDSVDGELDDDDDSDADV